MIERRAARPSRAALFGSPGGAFFKRTATASLTRAVTSSMDTSTFQFQVETGFFLRLSLGVEAVVQVIMLFVAELLQGIRADVVVGDAKSVGGHERTAATRIEAHAALLHMIQPGRARLETVLFLQLLRGRRVEKPHALVGASGRTGGDKEGGKYGGDNGETAGGTGFHWQ